MLIKRRKDTYSYIKQLSNKQIFGEDYFLLEVKD